MRTVSVRTASVRTASARGVPAGGAPVSEDRIAVTGLACRVPGADDPDALWRGIRAGTDAVRRYRPAELPAAVRDDPGWVPAFGHLDELTGFDAELFGYRDAEAALLDPQHRLFLEVALAACEDAAHDPSRRPEQVGVFAGSGPDRYLRHHLLGNPAVPVDGDLPEDWDDALGGSGPDYLPARVAYALGLTGPAVAVQTTCSSALVAVCLAAQSLLDFRCDVAVAGGAAVTSTRQAGYRYRPGGTLSPDGRCRPFGAVANGQVFGNGAAAVVLRRLEDALADGDPVHAVLAGWAVNNDGAGRAGFGVPGADGPAAVVVEALAAADRDPAEVGLVEAHGTGTPVGDALEVAALARAFRSAAARDRRCVLGSVKGNLGNLDAAAGAVGLLKAVLAVRDSVLPPTLLGSVPHRALELGDTFALLAAERTWSGPRLAGVSSFGQSGTNAHVLVEPAPAVPPAPGVPAGDGWQLLALSAGSPAALATVAARLADRLDAQPATALADVAHTLAVGRRPLRHRAAVLARDTAEATARLRELAAGTVASRAPGEPAKLAAWATDWSGGVDLDPSTLGGSGRATHLPAYPFERRRHWIDPPGGAR